MKKNGFAPVIILVLVIFLGFFGYFVYKKVGFKPISNKQDNIYMSPLGFSFKKNEALEIKEYSVDIEALKKLGDVHSIDPPYVDTKKTSVGTQIETDSYGMDVTKIEYVGKVPKELSEKMVYGGGDFFQFLYTSQWFDEIKKAIDKKSSPESFRFSGQIKRYDITPFISQNGQLKGITNFRISGYEIPNLGLFKEYFLIDSNNKFIFYIYSDLKCDKRESLEESYRIYNKDGTSWTIKEPFDSDDYLNKLKSVSAECALTSKNRTNLDEMLNSLTITEN